MRIVNWNLKYNCCSSKKPQQLETIRSLPWDVLTLQEVTNSTYRALSEMHPRNARIPLPDNAGDWTNGAAIFVRNGLEIVHFVDIAGLPRSAKGIAATVTGLSFPITVISWHAENAVPTRNETKAKYQGVKPKMRSYKAIDNFLAAASGPLVLGCDANGGFPAHCLKPQPLKHNRTDRWYRQHRFFSAEAKHRLRSAHHRRFLGDCDGYEKFVETNPNGPVSYIRPQRDGTVAHDCRDHILVSDDFAVKDCVYEYEGGVDAGSDHAYIYAELAVT